MPELPMVMDTDTGEITFASPAPAPATPETLSEAERNEDFVQLYRQFIYDLSELGKADANALTVFLFMVRNMDTANAIMTSLETISDFTGISRQTVSKKIKYLIENGWVSSYKVGHESVYVINDDVVWTSKGNRHKYCKFKATVMLPGDAWNTRAHADKVKRIDKDIVKSFRK